MKESKIILLGGTEIKKYSYSVGCFWLLEELNVFLLGRFW